MSARALGLIGLLGGLGGAINAALCYMEWPVPVGEGMFAPIFHWHIIPAGALHGSVLVLMAVAFARMLYRRSLPLRLCGAGVAGWLAGWLSWIPLSVSFGEDSFEMTWRTFWPFTSLSEIWQSFEVFGLVTACYCMSLCIRDAQFRGPRFYHLLRGIVSGVAGSLWFWVHSERWYFSLIHGAIWGSLVGFGVWKSIQRGWLPVMQTRGRLKP